MPLQRAARFVAKSADMRLITNLAPDSTNPASLPEISFSPSITTIVRVVEHIGRRPSRRAGVQLEGEEFSFGGAEKLEMKKALAQAERLHGGKACRNDVIVQVS